MRTATGQCDSCELLRINGIVCHETGCPEAWRDERRTCDECGCKFTPESRFERYCDVHCAAQGRGLPCDCDFCQEQRAIALAEQRAEDGFTHVE